MASANASPLFDASIRALDKAGLLRPDPHTLPPSFNLYTVAEAVARYVEQTRGKDDLEHQALRLYDRTTIVQTALKGWCDAYHSRDGVQRPAPAMEMQR